MNDTFNFRRFVGYAAKTYRENSRKYMMYLLLLLCIQTGLLIITAISYSKYETVPGYIPGMFYIQWMWLVLGVLFVFSEMKSMRNRHTAAIDNTQPVSTFEKYIFIILNTGLIFSLVYWAVFLIVSFVASGVFGYGDMADYWLGDRGALSAMKFINEGMIVFIPIAIFAGATNIRSHLLAFLIVTVVAIPLLGSTNYLPWFLNSNVFDGIEFGYMFNGLSATLQSGATSMEYQTLPMFSKFFNWFPGNGYEFYIWAALLLSAGYFKLRERQVK